MIFSFFSLKYFFSAFNDAKRERDFFYEKLFCKRILTYSLYFNFWEREKETEKVNYEAQKYFLVSAIFFVLFLHNFGDRDFLSSKPWSTWSPFVSNTFHIFFLFHIFFCFIFFFVSYFFLFRIFFLYQIFCCTFSRSLPNE